MNKPLYKFYDLENLTQEDLNKLALERNTYKSIIDKIKEYIHHEYFKREQLGIVDKTFYASDMKGILELLEEVDKGGEQ